MVLRCIQDPRMDDIGTPRDLTFQGSSSITILIKTCIIEGLTADNLDFGVLSVSIAQRYIIRH